jgi:AraC family transcriptional regulator
MEIRTMTTLESTPSNPAPAIVNLIESAAASFEVDRAAAREYLFRAFALLKIQRGPAQQDEHTRRGLIGWQMKRVIRYIDENLSAPIKAKELADTVNLSKSHFFRSFKASLDMTPWDYITRRRVEVAQELMRTTDQPLAHIAVGCGLSDQSHLCRVFRRLVGDSPSAWRRANVQGFVRPLRARLRSGSPVEMPSVS